MSMFTSARSPLAVFSLTTALLGGAGCGTRGSGVAATETREVGQFSTIHSEGALNVIVHVGSDAQKVVLSGDDNILPEIETRVRGDKLVLEHEDWLRPDLPLVIEIWTPSLAGIEVSGASDVEVDGLSGGQFDLDLSGASDAELRGKVDRLDVDVSGAGDVDAAWLEATMVVVDMSGAGEAKVWATQTLEVDVSGAGRVVYWGDPGDVRQDISGAGSVTKHD
jgi:hypothetical protein